MDGIRNDHFIQAMIVMPIAAAKISRHGSCKCAMLASWRMSMENDEWSVNATRQLGHHCCNMRTMCNYVCTPVSSIGFGTNNETDVE
jgi:hypothetical protein